MLWIAVFKSVGQSTFVGFSLEYYISYALWAAFMARISASWMYEFRMTEEVESGSINGILVRPISFFNYYLSQMMGYKFATTIFSLIVPISVEFFMHSHTDLWRLPLVLCLVTYYLVFVHIMSMCICSSAFFFNRIHSFTVAKNLTLWLLSGELFPFDIAPEPYKSILLSLPFCNAVYIPVAYLTGRVQIDTVLHGFLTLTIGIIVVGFFANILWKSGLRKYSGTGA